MFAVPTGLFTGLSFAGWAVATFGPKRIMLLSSFLLAGFLVLAGMAPTSVLLMFALFFLGVSRTLLNLAANTGAIEVQGLYHRPIVSTFHGIWSLACFVAAGIGTLLIIEGVQPVVHFAIVASVAVLAAGFFSKQPSKSHQAIERRPFFVKPDRYLFLLGLMALSSMLCEGAMFDWSVNYFEKVVKVDKSLVTMGYIAFIITMAGGRLFGDMLIQRFGTFRILSICGTLMAAGFAIAAFFPFLIPAIVGFSLIGIGDSILVPVIYLLASKSEKMPASYALSSVVLIGNTGFLIGPLLIGNVSQHFGMPAVLAVLSGVSLLIILLSMLVKKQGP